MRGVFPRQMQVGLGRCTQNKRLKREQRLAGSSISLRNRGENGNGGFVITQSQLKRPKKITPRRAEGSGSTSPVDFANFLNTARRSTFEVANILFLLSENRYIEEADLNHVISELEQESRMIFAFIRTLRTQSND